jgi:hypothetical protein
MQAMNTPLLKNDLNDIDYNINENNWTLDEIFEKIPLSYFHFRLLFICGIAFMADAMEVALLSFISICAGTLFIVEKLLDNIVLQLYFYLFLLGSEWNLQNSEVASITAAVFAGQIFG